MTGIPALALNDSVSSRYSTRESDVSLLKIVAQVWYLQFVQSHVFASISISVA